MEIKKIEPGINQVICQKWEEWDDGWDRPDGFSLHLCFKALESHLEWSKTHDKPGHYWLPSGSPYFVGVGDRELAQLQTNGGSIEYPLFYEYPGSGGIDGWLPHRTSQRFNSLGQVRRQKRIQKLQRRLVRSRFLEYLD